MPDPRDNTRRKLTLRRRLLFSMVATLAFLCTLEVILRIAGVPPSPDRTTTWFSDHILLPPLWHERAVKVPQIRYMAAGQAHHFHPFAREKAPDTFRVLVFGSSAAHGYGVLEPGAFPHRLEQFLQRAVPDREIQVVNLGTVAWSSQQLLWAARRVYEAGDWDLFIVYEGHNELLELSSWKTYMKPGEHRRYTRVLLLNQRFGDMRIFHAVRWLLGKDEPPELSGTDPEADPTPPDDPDAIVGGREEQMAEVEPGRDPVAITPAMRLDGMNPVPREERARIGPLERRYATRTWTHNIGKLIGIARAHGTPVILMNPAPNDMHDPAFFPYAGEDGERFEQAIARAEDARGETGAAEAAQAALDMHPSDPRAHFVMGQNLLSVGRDRDALPHMIEARRQAEYPNRIVPEVSRAILDMEGRRGVAGVVDIEAIFRARDPSGAIGYDLVYDHCHPSAPANYLIAAELAREILDDGILEVPEMPPLDRWAQEGWDALSARPEPDPRLWEWTGLRYEGGESIYIADFQGDWAQIRQGLEEAAARPEATAMDWLWAGNARFYGYDVEGALDAWQQALRLDPGLCLADANMAHALRLVGARAQALGLAEHAVLCDPANAEYAAERDLLRRLAR